MSTERLLDGELNLLTGEIRRGRGESTLTDRELQLVVYLIQNQERVVSLDELHREVWKTHPSVVTRVAYHTATRARKKIEVNPTKPAHLVTAYGDGLQWVPLPKELPSPLEMEAEALYSQLRRPPAERFAEFFGAAERSFEQGRFGSAAALMHAAFRCSLSDPRLLPWMERILEREVPVQWRHRLEMDRIALLPDRQQCLRAIQRSVALAEEWGNPRARLLSLLNRATFARTGGDLESSKRDLEECSRIVDKVVQIAEEALLWKSWGAIHRLEGAFDRAEEAFQRALALEQQQGPDAEWSMAFTLGELGVLYCYQGSFSRAVHYFRWSIQLHENAHQHRFAAIGRENLAICLLSQGNVQEGIAMMEELLALYRSQGGNGATLQMELARGYGILGRWEEARRMAESAVAAFLGAEVASHRPVAMAVLAWIVARQGDEREAMRLIQSAQSLAEAGPHQQVQATVCFRHAQVERVLGREDSAEYWFRECVQRGGRAVIGFEYERWLEGK